MSDLQYIITFYSPYLEFVNVDENREIRLL